jgi:hypothetical protein
MATIYSADALGFAIFFTQDPSQNVIYSRTAGCNAWGTIQNMHTKTITI